MTLTRCLLVFLALTKPGFARQEKPIPELAKCLATITQKDVAATLDFLTSDRLAGRDTAQRGMYLAIEHLEKRLAAAKLEPAGTKDLGYRHAYSLDGIDAAETNTLEIAGEQGGFTALELRKQFIPARNSGNGEAEGELVFVGYAIAEKAHRWDDFAKVDVKGKIAVALLGEPRQDRDEKKFFEGKEMTANAGIGAKAKLAAEQGAKALLVVAPTAEEAEIALGAQLPFIANPVPMAGDSSPRAPYAIPVAVVSGPDLKASLGVDFAERRATIDQRRAPDSKPLAPARAKLSLAVRSDRIPVHNVIARFPARADSPRGDEVIVIGAHLDHIGVDDRGRIHHGADDNGGGSAAVLEIAEAFGGVEPFLDRAIVVMWFTGEEKGLFGSGAFAANPTIPKEKIFAMINLDIIARGRPKAIEATQPDEPTVLSKLLPTAGRLSGASFKIGDGGKQFFARSDHFEFHKIGVPTVFFNEGETNADYHRWSDTADKANESKVAGVAKIALALGCLAANTDLKGGLKR